MRATLALLIRMGRWAQAKRRGGRGGLGPSLPAPPAPTLSEDAGDLIQTAGGDDDTGGTIYLEEALAEGGPYTPRGSHAWASPWAWGTAAEFTGSWLRGYEVGNGVAYAGQSPYSEPYLVL